MSEMLLLYTYKYYVCFSNLFEYNFVFIGGSEMLNNLKASSMIDLTNT